MYVGINIMVRFIY